MYSNSLFGVEYVLLRPIGS